MLLERDTESSPLAVTLALTVVAGLLFVIGLQALPGSVHARPGQLLPAPVVIPVNSGPYVDDPSAADIHQEVLELRAARAQKRRAAINDRRLQRERRRRSERLARRAATRSSTPPAQPQVAPGTQPPPSSQPPPAAAPPAQTQPQPPAPSVPNAAPQTVPASAS